MYDGDRLVMCFSELIEEPTNTAKFIKLGDGGRGEAFQLTQQQQWLIQEDTPNQKLWDEVLASLKEGPVRFYTYIYIYMYIFLLNLMA